MTAAVVAYVDHQRVPLDLELIGTEELGEARRAHVGHVDVADAPGARLVQVRAVPRDPVPVAEGALVGEWTDDDPAPGAFDIHHRELGLDPRAVHQALGGRHLGTDREPGDLDDPLAGDDLDAHRGEGATGLGAPGIALHDAPDPPDPAGIQIEIGTEPARRPARWPAVVAADLVGVAGAELALELPEQVREVRPGRDGVDEREVALEHRRPVHPGEVLHPEVIPLEPPRLAEHLTPLGRWVHLHPDPPEVDPAGRPPGRVTATLGRLRPGRHRPEPLAEPRDEGRTVCRDREARDVGSEHLVGTRGEVERLECSRGATGLGGRAARATNWLVSQEELGRDHLERVVAALGHRHREDAPWESLGIELDRRHRGRGRLAGPVGAGRAGRARRAPRGSWPLPGGPGLAHPPGLGPERRGRPRREGDQVGAHRDREAVVEDGRVGNGVEAPPREEREPLARRVEHRLVVGELPRGRHDRGAPRHPGDADLGRACADWRRVGDERGVGRPGQVPYPAGRGLVGHVPRARGHLDEQEPAVQGCDREVLTVRRGCEVDQARHARNAEGSDRPAVDRQHHELVLTTLVAEGSESRPVSQPGHETVADPLREAVLAGGAVEEREGEGLAPDDCGERMTGGVQRELGEALRRVHETGPPLRAGTGHDDRDLLRRRIPWREAVEPPSRGVDHDAAVASRIAGVEVLVCAVASEVAPVRCHRVQVADPLVVGEEVDPLAEPHRAREAAAEVGEDPGEAWHGRVLTRSPFGPRSPVRDGPRAGSGPTVDTGAPVGVGIRRWPDPELARRPAPVALPPGGLTGVPTERHPAGAVSARRAEGEPAHRPEREPLGHRPARPPCGPPRA